MMEHESTVGGPAPRASLLWPTVAFEAGLGILAWGMAWFLGLPLWGRMSVRWPDLLLGLAATLPMLGAFFLSMYWPLGPFAKLHRQLRAILADVFPSVTWWQLAILSLAAGAGEELLFRGAAQQALCRWLGLLPGALLASLLFGLAHPFSLAYVAMATVFGAYLGWLFEASDNLLVAIIVHALYDWVALWVLLSNPAREL